MNKYIATGKTKSDLEVTFGATGAYLKHTAIVPAGTVVRKLDGGSNPWVVAHPQSLNLGNGLALHEAEHYGVRINESDILID